VDAGAGPTSGPAPERLELLRRYLDEIGGVPVLTAPEEAELAMRIRTSREQLLTGMASIPYTARALLRRWEALRTRGRVTGQLSELHDGTSSGSRSAQVDRTMRRIALLLDQRDPALGRRPRQAELPGIDRALARSVTAVRPTHDFLVSALEALEEHAVGGSAAEVGRSFVREVGMTRAKLRRCLRAPREALARHHEARDRFVRHNLRLVIFEAKKFRHMGVPFLDLIQEGNLGLLRAVEKFDERRGNRFSTYGIWWIQQSCVRAIQGASRTVRLPSHVFDGVRRYRNARERFSGQHGRPPSAGELAPLLGMAQREVEALERADTVTVTLDAPIVGTELTLGERLPAPTGNEGPGAVAEETLTRALASLLGELTPRERQILSWRFGLGDDCDRTLQEIGDDLGLSRERVRQIEKEALGKLRTRAPESLEMLLN
jgi:RNA polymerase sigma factor (sigma-70 family)